MPEEVSMLLLLDIQVLIMKNLKIQEFQVLWLTWQGL